MEKAVRADISAGVVGMVLKEEDALPVAVIAIPGPLGICWVSTLTAMSYAVRQVPLS